MSIVTLSNHKTFTAESGKSLLDCAKSQGTVLEYSCRNGRCGVCKANVIQGETELVQPELALTEEERSSGTILTCCRAAITDVELDIEDLGLLADIQIKTMPCRLDTLERLADDVVRVVLRTPPRSALFYLPGQYIDVIGKDGVRRSYSIANAVREDAKLELHIRQVANGVMSQYWFDEAQANDLLRLEGPLGTFCLRDARTTNLVFMATGTGIAPVKAMLEALAAAPESISNKHIYVYWGGRTEADLYWHLDFPTLDLIYRPTLSRANAQWSGATGYIQQAVLAENLDLADTSVYACGSEAMIHTAREVLTQAGLPLKHFHSDAFVSSN
ncbi:FAD-binding oxidoreductase [Pseudomonas canadensis]|uniref:FAD-binding oxidoreductase n=1 Tax=Pseudomonas canadensis TaxID=915099 RepID=UPI002B24096C|nr:FAD-binding oxidoreductase [Pseudomonas canadensis]MEB2646610.1 FAD-binding oxidoreductase [Pseudomonas canadensis]